MEKSFIISKGGTMKNISPLDLSLEQPKNFFSLCDFLPDDGELSKLISIHISALDLANYINPQKKQWITIDTIFLKARVKDVLELVPDAKPYIDNMTSDRIVSKLPVELSLNLLTKLKKGQTKKRHLTSRQNLYNSILHMIILILLKDFAQLKEKMAKLGLKEKMVFSRRFVLKH